MSEWIDKVNKAFPEDMNAKSREYYMADCLYDEMQGPLSYQRFTEWEIGFITNIYAIFFNNENAKLSPKQLEALEKIWNKD